MLKIVGGADMTRMSGGEVVVMGTGWKTVVELCVLEGEW